MQMPIITNIENPICLQIYAGRPGPMHRLYYYTSVIPCGWAYNLCIAMGGSGGGGGQGSGPPPFLAQDIGFLTLGHFFPL